MKLKLVISMSLATVIWLFTSIAAESHEVFPAAKTFLEQRIAEFDRIADDRKSDLKKVSNFVNKQKKGGKPVQLVFICTHNSRRSHMSQIWSSVAAHYYGIDGVETFSGGTESTAFNPRAIRALERAGLKIEKLDDEKNPHYAVNFSDDGQPLNCFSKKYSDAPNPKSGFCAVMTCSQADKSCPSVEGSELRVAIAFEDPKVSDDKPTETATYDERCQQIAREMLYLFSQVDR